MIASLIGKAEATTVPANAVDWRVLKWGLVGGGLIALSIILFSLVRSHKEVSSDPEGAQGLPPAATWKFTDSWASSLTALTTATGAILVALSEKLEKALKPGAVVAFAVTLLVLLAVAAMAPIAYTALQKYVTKHDAPIAGSSEPVADRRRLVGTAVGLHVACLLTLTSTFGSLCAVAALTQYGLVSASSQLKYRCDAMLALMASLICVYAWRTIKWLLEDASQPPGTGALPGLINVSCCERSGDLRRFSLL